MLKNSKKISYFFFLFLLMFFIIKIDLSALDSYYVNLVEDIIDSDTFNLYMSSTEVSKCYEWLREDNDELKLLYEIDNIGSTILADYSNINLDSNSSIDDIKKLHLYELFLCSEDIYYSLSDDEINQLYDLLEDNLVNKGDILGYPYLSFAYEYLLQQHNSVSLYDNTSTISYKTITGETFDIEINYSGSELSNERKEELYANDIMQFPNIIKLRDASSKYECYTYAWYSQEEYEYHTRICQDSNQNGIITFGIGGGFDKIEDNIPLQKGNILHYCEGSYSNIKHAAIIEDNPYNYTLNDLLDINKAKDVYVVSKWGESCLYYHSVKDYTAYGINNNIFYSYTPLFDVEINNLDYSESTRIESIGKTYKINNNGTNAINFDIQYSSTNIDYSMRLYNCSGAFVKEFTETDYNMIVDDYELIFNYITDEPYIYLRVECENASLSPLVSISQDTNVINLEDDYIEENVKLNTINQIVVDTTGTYLFTLTNSTNIKKVELYDEDYNLIKEAEIINNRNYIIHNLDGGIYYLTIHSNNLLNIYNYSLKIRKYTNEIMSNAIIVDPSNLWNCGSQIEMLEEDLSESNKSYLDNTIVEGFSRICYFDTNLITATSRLDFTWISSNENILKVTDYGTVIGKNVDELETVTIYAISKTDPTIVYTKEFEVVPYEGDYIDINIDLNYNVGDEMILDIGEFIPYNFMQAYSWVSSNEAYLEISNYGIIKAKLSGPVTINGSYLYNEKVRIFINVSISDGM